MFIFDLYQTHITKSMHRYFILFALLFMIASANAQTHTTNAKQDTSAGYLKNPTIPPFTIQLPDSSWFSAVKLQAKKPTLILYFSPDCGHCQIETEEVLSRMKELKNLQIVMITSRPFADMANFAEHYKLNRFPSIKVGTDPSRMITQFYAVKFTPFSALYDKKWMLVKVYEKGINIPELIHLTK